MAFVHSRYSVFQLDDAAGTLRNLTPYVDNVSGLPGNPDLTEVTAFGDAGTKTIPGLENVTFTVSGSWDTTATTGSHVVIAGLRGLPATSTFEYGPAGNTTGLPKFSGECRLQNFEVSSGVGDKVSYTANFQVEGTVIVGVY